MDLISVIYVISYFYALILAQNLNLVNIKTKLF
nr:MAG TPA: hypothetical protein [Caudoviricetes sp.]